MRNNLLVFALIFRIPLFFAGLILFSIWLEITSMFLLQEP